MKKRYFVHKVFASFPVTLDLDGSETAEQINEMAINEVETKQIASVQPTPPLVVTEAAQ